MYNKLILQNIKKIPYALAIIRAISFIPIILSTFNILPISLLLQLLLAIIIIISDKYDGEISRKNNNEKDKLKFRIFDTTIDKTGIILCLIGLLSTGKIPTYYFIILISYNAILLSGGAVNLLITKEKKEATAQGLFISRLFTIITGLSILLFNNFEINNILKNLLTIIMGILGVISLKNQLTDKMVQKRMEVKK